MTYHEQRTPVELERIKEDLTSAVASACSELISCTRTSTVTRKNIEEAPGAYNDINEVVRVSNVLGIETKVARMRPGTNIGVSRGSDGHLDMLSNQIVWSAGT
ncbi:RtcB family protein [Halobium salinum]|uniref:tRNA-splicing ligase RtcB n=1 Tax=Halobium salinum TaxID=1364940 RepID=A0ABD5PI96_9EURY|nr:RtcB family protein [Halobium salinum]